MRKELGKWLMDISKYIITAVLLSTVFGDLENRTNVYIIGLSSMFLTLVIGLFLVRDPKPKTNKKGKNNNKKR